MSKKNQVLVWKTIDTAPKDRRILIYCPTPAFTGREVSCGEWDYDKYINNSKPYWRNDYNAIRRYYQIAKYQPTHWMEIPEFS